MFSSRIRFLQEVMRKSVKLKAGNGGDPDSNALRSKSLKGPGYGGHGGSIFFKADPSLISLVNIPNIVEAESGGNANSTERNSRGLPGKDTIVSVPLGTILRDQNGRFLYQFMKDEEMIKVSPGGVGGVAPSSRKLADGRSGQRTSASKFDLEVRLLNDVCVLGFPTSGKTSLISALGASPLSRGFDSLVGELLFADGSSIRLLDFSHKESDWNIEQSWRSHLLVYVADVTCADPIDGINKFRNQVESFGSFSKAKPWLVVVNKLDLLHHDSLVQLDSITLAIQRRFGSEVKVIGTSARLGLGIENLALSLHGVLLKKNLQLC